MIFIDDITYVGFIVGLIISLILIIFLASSSKKPKKEDLNDLLVLALRAETPIFSNPKNAFCAIYAIEEGLKIITSSPGMKCTNILKYENIHKFQFDKTNNFDFSKILEINPQDIPDKVYLEYTSDDGISHSIIFNQTKSDKLVNYNVLKYVNIFQYVNERINHQ